MKLQNDNGSSARRADELIDSITRYFIKGDKVAFNVPVREKNIKRGQPRRTILFMLLFSVLISAGFMPRARKLLVAISDEGGCLSQSLPRAITYCNLCRG